MSEERAGRSSSAFLILYKIFPRYSTREGRDPGFRFGGALVGCVVLTSIYLQACHLPHTLTITFTYHHHHPSPPSRINFCSPCFEKAAIYLPTYHGTGNLVFTSYAKDCHLSAGSKVESKQERAGLFTQVLSTYSPHPSIYLPIHKIIDNRIAGGYLHMHTCLLRSPPQVMNDDLP